MSLVRSHWLDPAVRLMPDSQGHVPKNIVPEALAALCNP